MQVAVYVPNSLCFINLCMCEQKHVKEAFLVSWEESVWFSFSEQLPVCGAGEVG